MTFRLPSVVNEVVHEACPLFTGTVFPPLHVKSLAASLNVTAPSFAVGLDDTVAVNVTELPGDMVKDGLLFEETEVVVGAPVMITEKLAVALCGAVMVMLVVALVELATLPVQLLKL